MSLTKVTYSMIQGAVANVLDYGAVADGSTDSSTQIQAALDAGYAAVYVPEGNYYCSTGLTIPAGVTLFGTGFIPSTSGTVAGSVLTFGLSVAVCVTLSGNAGLESAGLREITVTRASGSVSASTVGVLVSNGYNPIIEDVASIRHGICFKFDGSSGGISCSPNRIFTAHSTDSHVLIYNWPELRVNQSRFGSNGTVDTNCNSFVRFSGTGIGPNTINFVNCQFNQGVSTGDTVGAFLDFKDMVFSPILQPQIYNFTECHIENVSYVVQSNSGSTQIKSLLFANTRFQDNTGTSSFWNIDAATSINNFKMSNCEITTGTYNYNIANQTNWFQVTNCLFSQAGTNAVIVNGIANSSIEYTNCSFTKGLTVTGAFGSGSAVFSGVSSGTVSCTATGRVELDINGGNNWITATNPVLAFGTSGSYASTGITYSVQKARYKVSGSLCFYEFEIQLSNKGSATGNAVITNLPFAPSPSISTATSSAVLYCTNMGSLVSNVQGSVGTNNYGTGVYGADLYQMDISGGTGVSVLTNSNFTNTSKFSGMFVYAI